MDEVIRRAEITDAAQLSQLETEARHHLIDQRGGAALLADEPVTALDPYHQLQVMEILRARADTGTTVIVVLHEITLAARFCDHLLLLDNGRVAASGSPNDVLTDQNLRTTYRVSALRGESDGAKYLLPWQRTDKTDTATGHKSG